MSVSAVVVALVTLGDIDTAVRRAIAAHLPPTRLLWVRSVGYSRSEQGTGASAKQGASGVSTNGLTEQRTAGAAQDSTCGGALLLLSLCAAGKGRAKGNDSNGGDL